MNTYLSDPTTPLLASTRLGFEQAWRPVRRWNLGLAPVSAANQIQQVKSAVVTVAPSVSPAVLMSSTNTQGVAQPVQNLRITRAVLNSQQVRVTVGFTPANNDHYFQGVAVSLSQGNGNPVQAVTGRQSPLTLVLQRTSAAVSLAVQSLGAFGNSPQGFGFGTGRGLSLR